MELQTKKLEDFEIINLRNLSSKRTELIYSIGELYLEIAEFNKMINQMEIQHSEISNELNTLLQTLNEKYPNGEIDLNEGTVTFEK